MCLLYSKQTRSLCTTSLREYCTAQHGTDSAGSWSIKKHVMWRSENSRGFNDYWIRWACCIRTLETDVENLNGSTRGGRRGLLPQPLKKAHVLADPRHAKQNQSICRSDLVAVCATCPEFMESIPKRSKKACLFNLHCNFSIASLQSAIAMCRPRRWSLGVACSDCTHSHPHDNYHQVPQLSFSFPSLKFLVGLTPSCH